MLAAFFIWLRAAELPADKALGCNRQCTEALQDDSHLKVPRPADILLGCEWCNELRCK